MAGFRIVMLNEEDAGRPALFARDAAEGLRALADFFTRIGEITVSADGQPSEIRLPDQLTLAVCAEVTRRWADRIQSDGLLMAEGLVGHERSDGTPD